METYQQWIQDFLNGIGAPLTSSNINFMQAWINKESGAYPITYGWNPLNTTQAEPGSYGGGSQGNIQFFPNYQSGLQANIKTILNGLYGDVVNALRNGTASTNANYSGLNTWGTGSLNGSPTRPIASNNALQPSQVQQASLQSTMYPLIGPLAFLLPGGQQELSADIIVGGAAVIFILIGAAWIILGNQDTRKIFIAKAKDALV